MSDINIKAELDLIDKLSVSIYRTSFFLAAVAMLLKPFFPQYFNFALLSAALISATTVHIYDKNIRTIIQWVAVIAVIFLLFSNIAGFTELAIGGAFFVYCALAIKEYFCFRSKCLLAIPIALPLFWLSIVLAIETNAINTLSMISGLLLAYLGVSKWRMPLHYDIGDKTKFQI